MRKGKVSWINKTILNESSVIPEQALRDYYENINVSAISKMEQIQLYVQDMESAFSVSDIYEHFLFYKNFLFCLKIKKLS